MRARRGDGPVHLDGGSEEAESQGDRATPESEPVVERTLRQAGAIAAGTARPSSPTVVLGEDFSTLLRFRRLRVKRGKVRVLS